MGDGLVTHFINETDMGILLGSIPHLRDAERRDFP
jgi:hypothetical protein